MTDRRPDGTQPGDNRLMMVSPRFWYHWPFLTLKKSTGTGMPRTALLYDRYDEGEELAGEFRFLDDSLLFLTTRDEIRKAPIANIDKLIDDGWVID